MTDAEVKAFIANSLQGYVEQRVAAGEDAASAARVAAEQYADFFPGDRPAAGHQLLTAEHGGVAVGVLWLGPMRQAPDDPTRAWVYDIEVAESHRGRGLGRALLSLAEEHVAADGVVELGLNVFGGNDVARGLYTSAGYVERSVQMSKRLDSEG